VRNGNEIGNYATVNRLTYSEPMKNISNHTKFEIFNTVGRILQEKRRARASLLSTSSVSTLLFLHSKMHYKVTVD